MTNLVALQFRLGPSERWFAFFPDVDVTCGLGWVPFFQTVET